MSFVNKNMVEVIRCRDCLFFHPDTYSDNWCSAKAPGISKGMCTPSADSYCSDAVRKEPCDKTPELTLNEIDSENFLVTAKLARDMFTSKMTGEWYKPACMMPPEFTGRHRCSVCEGFAMHDWKHHREQLTPFCPHCGAKMEKRSRRCTSLNHTST